jgi:Beta-carotene isomerase D27-like, C-terminal
MISLRAIVFLLVATPLAKAFSSSSCIGTGVRDSVNWRVSTLIYATSSEKSNGIKPEVALGADVDLSDVEAIGTRLMNEAKEVAACLQIVASSLFISREVNAEDIVKFCDELDALESSDELFVSRSLQLRQKAMEFRRYEMLVSLMKSDYDAYVATAGFLSPSRIPRLKLPNLQDVPYHESTVSKTLPIKTPKDDDGMPLVADCELSKLEFNESPLDKLLLKIFRNLVEKNTGGVKSDKPGIDGLLEQGRMFMLQEGQTPEAQHKMVSETLGGLMTPVLPPFYRIFMSGIVPKLGTDLDGKQLGPWFYAPFLTSVVTPTFFGFLVGPSYPNRRKDGQPGGLVVEKCKFLQESGCKGLCLNQCKLPAQQFFKEQLGLPLTVSPNFVTQECQWSFGEEPLPPAKDPAFPKGCLVGCESRKAMAGRIADICN